MVDWLELSQSSGSGDTQILIRALPNVGDSVRSTTLVLSGLTKHIDITAQQDFIVDEITISPDVAIFRYTGGTNQFSVTSKTNWEINSYPNWLTLSTLSGYSGTTILTATAQPNTSTTPSTSDIVVLSSYGVDSSVVTLEGAPEILEVSPTSFNIPLSGGIYQFTITSNSEWTITPVSSQLLPLSFSTTAGTPGTTVVTVTADTNVYYERTSIFRVSGFTKHEDISFHQEGESDYFRMVILPTSESGSVIFNTTDRSVASVLSYRKNFGDWVTITASTLGTYINVSSGDTLEFKGNNQSMGYSNKYNYFNSTSGVSFDTEGDITSLLSTSYTITRLNSYAFRRLFYYCTGLRNINNTWGSVQQLSIGCFFEMYANCTNLIDAENALPNAELYGGDYSQEVYRGMFMGCTKLTHPPVMHTTSFSRGCCYQMFKGCTSLVETMSLPSNITFLNGGCFEAMYQGCTSLTTAHELPVTALTSFCYREMFAGCTSLTTAPSLPVTTLTDYCYYEMFSGCTSLTTGPVLPASTMTDYCYVGMFRGCTSLTSAPALPAMSLSDNCYESMFRDCTSLTIAPELPATTLVPSCYYGMFSGCTTLNNIKCLAVDNTARYCTTNWVTGVANSGTFIKDSSATWSTGNSGIPSGWTVEDAT